MDDILKQILNELKELKAGQQETNTRLTNIESDITELKADVSGLKTDTISLKQAVLETNETVKRIEGRQEHQQRVIEELAYKSVEHDAELKRIK